MTTPSKTPLPSASAGLIPSLVFALSLGLCFSMAQGQTPAVPGLPTNNPAPTPPQAELEAAFIKTLTEATLSGRWCLVKDGQLTPEKDDLYHIVSVQKLEGDNWIINARMKYGGQEIVAPLPAQVKWAGDTAVICITDLAMPTGKKYSARLLIYQDTYAGTWSGGASVGLLNGQITRDAAK